MKLLRKSTILISLFCFNCFAYEIEEFLPSNIYLMDENFSHHILLVEKSTHSLFVYENQNGFPKLVKKYNSATGKFNGNKSIQGDRKTPEGVYYLNEFFESKELIEKYGEYGKIYGAGAFTTNYPNIMDARQGKTGGGIWLHSVDDEARVSKGTDSRGCVLVVDNDLKEISQFIDLKNTSMIIVQDLKFLNKETWEKNRNEIKQFVDSWASAWKNKDFDKYINSYSKELFESESKGNFTAYKSYKKAIFAKKDKPDIYFSNLSVMYHSNYAVVQMQQDYNSAVIQDIGKKTLYLVKDENYNWKIVAEQFSKIEGQKEKIAFIPSMRFFKDSKKEQQ